MEVEIVMAYNSLSDLAIAGVLAMLMITGGTLFYLGVFAGSEPASSDWYDANASSGVANSSQKIYDSSQSIYSNLNNSQSAAGETFPVVLLTGGYEAIRNLFGILDGMTSLVYNIGIFFSALFGFDVGWIISGIITLFAVTVTLLVLSIVLGRKV